jgi:hypothetical protein
MGKSDEVTDMTRGQYRRQYAGYLRGRRINAVGLSAEAWFWRVNVTVDDFGNGDADPVLLHAATVGRRTGVSAEDVRSWVDELVREDLLRRYEVGRDVFIHVVDFTLLQSAGRNGKRVRRFPESPWDADELARAGIDLPAQPAELSEGETRGIRVNPKASKKSGAHYNQYQYQDHNQNQNNPAAQGGAEAGKPPAAPAATASAWVFQCVGGRKNGERAWTLTPAYVAELAAAFPGVDVPQQARAAHVKYHAQPTANRKTADRMPEFLWNWMKNEQNAAARRSGGGGDDARPRRESIEDRARRLGKQLEGATP